MHSVHMHAYVDVWSRGLTGRCCALDIGDVVLVLLPSAVLCVQPMPLGMLLPLGVPRQDQLVAVVGGQG